MESVYEFANELYVQWKDWMSELICSFFDLAKLPTETKFSHLEYGKSINSEHLGPWFAAGNGGL